MIWKSSYRPLRISRNESDKIVQVSLAQYCLYNLRQNWDGIEQRKASIPTKGADAQFVGIENIQLLTITRKTGHNISLLKLASVKQEQRGLLSIPDFFKKIVVVGDNIKVRRDENGIITIGIKNFLLDKNSLKL